MDVEDRLLLIGATMRLTRLVVVDDIGQWWVKDPVIDWLRHGDDDRRRRWQGYAGGLDCPFCVGFWIGVLVLVGYHLLPRRLWRFGATALTLNEVAAHLGAQLGDTAE